jgi:hypothetical protein
MAHKLNNSKRTIAVDFDGVIAEYDGYKGPGVLGEPRLDVIDALRTLRAEGWKIVIHTTRGEQEIVGYLTQHGTRITKHKARSRLPTSIGTTARFPTLEMPART